MKPYTYIDYAHTLTAASSFLCNLGQLFKLDEAESLILQKDSGQVNVVTQHPLVQRRAGLLR